MQARTYYPRCRVVLELLLEDFADGASSELHHVDLVPRSVLVRRNSHREADTFRVELDYRDFPFDPRALRQVRVAVSLGHVSGPDSELGEEDLVCLGLVDEPESQLSEGGERVQLEGRDFTGLLLDHTWGGAALDVQRPLSAVVDSLLEATPGAAGLLREYTNGADALVLADILGRTKWAPASEQDDAWTVLADLVAVAGLYPVVELDTLHIRKAGQYQRRSVSMRYGANLSRLTFRRRFNGHQTRQVRVVSWDEVAGESRAATWPREPVVLRQKIGADGRVSTDKAPVIDYFVTGSYGTDELELVAESIYEEAARQQVQGSLETHDLTDLEGAEDLSKVANGDQVVVRLGKAFTSSVEHLRHHEAVDALTRGSDAMIPSVAEALVTAMELAESEAVAFYIERATHRWSREDGYSLEATFINFVGG